MRTVEELVKEVTEDMQRENENNAKYSIQNCIQEIGRQQTIIKIAEETIKKLQISLKSVEIMQLPTNFLV